MSEVDMVNYEIQSFDLVFEVSDKGRILMGDLIAASTKAADPIALKIAARQRFAPAEDLAPQLAEAQATIAHLTARIQALAPNLAEILPQLLEAGLTAWADLAVATYNDAHMEGADSLMPVVAQLYAAATKNDIAAVPPLFSEIMQRSMVAPTSAEATAMQAILDGVQFPPELISFHPWIKL